MGKVQEVRSDEKMEVSYMMWQLKYQDAVEEGRNEGREEGRIEGHAQGILQAIQTLMKNLGLTLEQAMDTLEIPEAERKTYDRLLKQ